MTTIVFFSLIFLLPLFGATYIPNLKFLAYAYRELWPPPGPGRVRKSPVLIGLIAERA